MSSRIFLSQHLLIFRLSRHPTRCQSFLSSRIFNKKKANEIFLHTPGRSKEKKKMKKSIEKNDEQQ
jgi:hypothetical protein